MNNLRRFEFFSKERRDPYIDKLIDYKISETEGYIHFDGYYYVMNEEFPKRIFFNTSVLQTDNEYKVIEDKFYEVEIYDREKMKNTSSYDEVEEDGSKMRICYFPTHEQKIIFKIIQSFNNFEDFLHRTTEYFKQEDEKN